MSINDWFEKITGGESYNAVAKKAGVQASSIWRQLPDRLSEKNMEAVRGLGVVPFSVVVAVSSAFSSSLTESGVEENALL